MTKKEKIAYLNSIKKYLNLSAVCKEYNDYCNDYIDYNNLRIVLNGNSETRLSEKKLDSFLDFLYTYLFKKVFKINNIVVNIDNLKIKDIIELHSKKLNEDILGEIKNGLLDK